MEQQGMGKFITLIVMKLLLRQLHKSKLSPKHASLLVGLPPINASFDRSKV
jgi:hypothetical protein